MLRVFLSLELLRDDVADVADLRVAPFPRRYLRTATRVSRWEPFMLKIKVGWRRTRTTSRMFELLASSYGREERALRDRAKRITWDVGWLRVGFSCAPMMKAYWIHQRTANRATVVWVRGLCTTTTHRNGQIYSHYFRSSKSVHRSWQLACNALRCPLERRSADCLSAAPPVGHGQLSELGTKRVLQDIEIDPRRHQGQNAASWLAPIPSSLRPSVPDSKSFNRLILSTLPGLRA